MKIHSRKMNLTRGIDLKKIAEKMGGASGAEVKGVCTEAGMYALRERRVHVTQEDFEMAVSKILKQDSEQVKTRINVEHECQEIIQINQFYHSDSSSAVSSHWINGIAFSLSSLATFFSTYRFDSFSAQLKNTSSSTKSLKYKSLNIKEIRGNSCL